MQNFKGTTTVEKIEIAIEMLNTYASEDGLESFILVLEKLKQDPDNESVLQEVADAFQNLGLTQGAVLTYAPSIYEFIVKNPFND